MIVRFVNGKEIPPECVTKRCDWSEIEKFDPFSARTPFERKRRY